jgi:hypothetical protein
MSRVLHSESVTSLTDVQIQQATSKLGFSIRCAAGFDPEKLLLTLKLETKNGPRHLVEKQPLITLLEIAAFGEGFFVNNTIQDTGAVDEGTAGGTASRPAPGYVEGKTTFLEGAFDVCRTAALDLNQSSYLSLDLYTTELGVSLDDVEIYAMGGPVRNMDAQVYEPTTIQGGITKDINLSGIEYIALPLSKIESLRIEYEPSGVVEMTQTEARIICRDLNDLVSYNSTTRALSAGLRKWVVMEVKHAVRMSVTPLSDAPFYVYTIKSKTF